MFDFEVLIYFYATAPLLWSAPLHHYRRPQLIFKRLRGLDMNIILSFVEKTVLLLTYSTVKNTSETMLELMQLWVEKLYGEVEMIWNKSDLRHVCQ